MLYSTRAIDVFAYRASVKVICANGLYVAVITLVCAPVNANPHGRTVGRPGDF